MKSIHWLICFIVIWVSSAVTSIVIDVPEIFVAPIIVSIVIIIALSVTGNTVER